MSLILDRRIRDTNGHMHVADCVITRGIVSQYVAHELDGAVDRGYQPNDMVSVYRDPDALKLGLDSFRDIPLMRRHIIVSANEPQKDDIIGTVSNPRMNGDDLLADLTFWSAEDGIDPVMSDEVDNLSCGYGYGLDWTPGEVNGLRYVASMNRISANHLALVSKGRVPGARVADQKPSESVMTDKSKFPRIIAALATALGLKPEQTLAIDTALNAELGGETAIEDPKVAADKAEADRLVADQAAKDAADKVEADKVAQDAAVKVAVDTAVANTHALYAAREAVSNKVGVTALDSAEATYRFALDKSGVTHAALAADTLPALWEATNKPAAQDAALLAVDVSNVFSSHIRKG